MKKNIDNFEEKLKKIIYNYSWRSIDDNPEEEEVRWFNMHNKALEMVEKEIIELVTGE